MEIAINILGADYLAFYDYKITCNAQRATGPTYDCGGQPAEPMEYEITLSGVIDPVKLGAGFLDLPQWLEDVIVQHLSESDRVYSDIDRDAADY